MGPHSQAADRNAGLARPLVHCTNHWELIQQQSLIKSCCTTSSVLLDTGLDWDRELRWRSLCPTQGNMPQRLTGLPPLPLRAVHLS